MHNPKDRYRQLKSVLTKAKTIEDLLPASVYILLSNQCTHLIEKTKFVVVVPQECCFILRIMTLRTGTQELLKNYLVRERVKFV